MPVKAPPKPAPGAVVVDVTAPPPRGAANAMFVYVPGDGLFASDGKTWTKASAGNHTANALRRAHHLSIWLTKNPLAVVYANVTEAGTMTVTDLFQGGTWASPEYARGVAPKLPWAELPRK